jgi:hypothetical protein
MKNYTLILVTLVALAFAVAFGISQVNEGTAKANPSHSCVAPCVVKFAPGTQEDEVAWDFEGSKRGTVRVTRACDHYCFEALTQGRARLGRNLCKDFTILPVLTDRGDRWPITCKTP